MLPITWIQKAILLLGEGGTGKSTFLTGLIAFLGKLNVSTMPLHRLEVDRFASARLLGKLANVCADLPSTELETTSTFKAITGGDSIPAEYKFADSFDFTPFARLIYSANEPPPSRDASPAFFDRWLVVPLDRIYRGTTEERSRQEIDAELASESELSGVLNKALAVVGTVMRDGLTKPKSCIDARDDFQKVTDPLAIWLARSLQVESDAEVDKGELLRSYNEFARGGGRPGITATSFSLRLKRTFKEALGEKYSNPTSGERRHMWVGIRLIDDPIRSISKECKRLGIQLRLIDGGADFEVIGNPPARLSDELKQYAGQILEILNRTKREKAA
jgi:putative DNA primase/helicase